ncbi:MAG TPA: undecaprenyl-phosphate glucose phosphotransferase, partial [Burkholderiaceae bacterium]|nr:undecaprenyl-phosphate glucose phosphotransferase [Burkholderiaceae bacterium]
MQNTIGKNASPFEFSLRLIDVLAIEVASQLASLLHFNVLLQDGTPIQTALVFLCCALAFLLLPQLGLYNSWRGRSMAVMFGRIAAAWALVLLIGLFFSFLIHHVGYVSRLWVFYWYVIGVGLLVLSRIVVYSTL